MFLGRFYLFPADCNLSFFSLFTIWSKIYLLSINAGLNSFYITSLPFNKSCLYFSFLISIWFFSSLFFLLFWLSLLIIYTGFFKGFSIILFLFNNSSFFFSIISCSFFTIFEGVLSCFSNFYTGKQLSSNPPIYSSMLYPNCNIRCFIAGIAIISAIAGR